ncbi:MAG: 16S rRNA (guanine(966)-N(2))-methyltransferase RsmD [Bacillota bacterium]|nr:16S rRNA (guanine(966)-N(2))-methyltransferase RsmD [Bacillota bacterium]
MRVIAGMYRRRLLKEADKHATRPTTDKNREMVFNVLGQFFDGGTVLDLYAGTGAMGIEALSRGCTRATFVDCDPVAIRTINDNLENLHVSRQTVAVIRAEAQAWLLANRTERFDLIFLDPPYAQAAVPETIRFLAEHKMLVNDGIVVAETDRAFHNASDFAGLALYREIPAGNSKFAFYRWGEQS